MREVFPWSWCEREGVMNRWCEGLVTYILLLIHHSGFMKAQFSKNQPLNLKILSEFLQIMLDFGFFLANSISPVGDVRSYPSSKPFYEKNFQTGWLMTAKQDSSKTIPNYLQKIASLKVELLLTFPGRGNCRFFLLLEGCGKTVPGNGIDEMGSSWETRVEMHKLP